jgi:translocation and assembly module TamB
VTALSSRSVRIALLLGALVVVGALLALRSQTAWDQLCTLARRELPKALGAEVGIGRCEVDPGSRTVRLGGVSIYATGEELPVFSADMVEVTLGGFEPFTGRILLDRLRVTRPRVRVDLSRPSTARPSAACPFQALQAVSIDDLDVRGAEAHILLPDGRGVDVEGISLGWRMRRRVAEFRVETSQGSVQPGAGIEALPLTGLRVEGELARGGRDLEVTRGELSVGDAELSFSGRIDDLCHPTLALDAQAFLPMRALSRATGALPGASGHLWARLAVSGRAPDIRYNGELLGKGLEIPPSAHPGDFSAHFALAGETLTLHDFVIPVPPGQVKVSGTARLVAGLPVKLRVDAEGASLAHILDRAGVPDAWVDFAISGQVTAQGKLAPTPLLQGEAALHTANFLFTPGPTTKHPRGRPPILAFPGGDIHLELRVLSDRVELRDAEIRVGEGRAKVNATFGFAQAMGLSISGAIDPLDLHEVGPLLGIPWSGVGSSRFSLGLAWGELVHIDADIALKDAEFRHFALGTVKSPLHFADEVLTFADVVGLRGKSPFTGAAKLDFRGEALTVEARAHMPEGRVEDLVEVVAPLSQVWQPVRKVLTGTAKGEFHLWGPSEALDADIDFTAADVAFHERRLGAGGIHLQVRDETLELLPATLRGPLGTTQAEGRLTTEDALNFHFRIDGMPLEEVLGAGARRSQARGILTLAGTVRGTSDVPDVQVTLTSPQATLSGRSLGPVRLEGHMLGEHLEISGHPINDVDARLTAEVRRPYPFEARLALGLSDLRSLLGDGWQGALRGTLTASGSLLEIEATEGKLHLEQVRLQRGDVKAENDGVWDLRFGKGRVETAGVSLRGPETALTVSGSASARTMDVKVAGTLDLRLVEPFTHSLDRLAGRIEISGTAEGNPREPALLGNANLLEVGVGLRDSGLELRGLTGRIDFSETRLLWTDVRGQLNDGQFSSRGDLSWGGFSITQLAASAHLEDVTLRLLEDAPFSATGDLLLSGKPGAFRLSGDLEVARLRYIRPFGVDALVRPRSVGGSEAERNTDWLTLDVLLHLKDARVDNNVARARLLGELRVTGSILHPGLVGTVEAGEGSQAFFRGNAFNITQGVADFKDRHSLEGVFDVYAETQVRDYQIRLHAFGRSSAPQVQFSSDPAMPEGDVLSLLTLGLTARERAGISGTTGAGAGLAAEALYQASGLDRQVQRFLPRNSVLRDPAFRISTQYSEGTGLVEPTAQLESKFLVDQLKLSLSQPVSGRGTHAQAEYRFDNRLSAQAQWDNAYSDLPIGNLGIDLKLRWEVE